MPFNFLQVYSKAVMSLKRKIPLTETVEGILRKDHRILSKTITIFESILPEDREFSIQVLEELKKYPRISLRIGISGIPGAGKSTFIEGFGKEITRNNKTLAVLTTDPSSIISGGSILGDKTRMEKLAADPAAYIRSSSSQNHLGGTAPATSKIIQLCEHAGFDVIIAETVGAGQSEADIVYMTDYFLLLMVPGGGDELQAIKRGILELADYILVNKADGEWKQLATTMQKELNNIYSTIYHDAAHKTYIQTFTNTSEKKFMTFWKTLFSRYSGDKLSGAFMAKRDIQKLSLFNKNLEKEVLNIFFKQEHLQLLLKQVKSDLVSGKISEEKAIKKLMEHSKGIPDH